MPQISSAAASRFNSLKIQTLNAIRLVNDRRREASHAGRIEDERALVAERDRLRAELFSIADAEEAYLRSTLSVQEAERRLREAADAARRHVARIASIQSALTEAAGLVTLLARLATVF